jgi:hypothetical protein
MKTVLNTAWALLAGALLLVPTAAFAGPLGNLAGTLTLHRATGAPRAAAVSLAGLPMLRAAPAALQRPMALDTPRASALNIREESRVPAAGSAAAAPHNPQGLHWEDASATVSPRLVSLARNYHHDGLPVVKLWQADRNMVSIGLNPHGVPGIFFTQTLGK